MANLAPEILAVKILVEQKDVFNLAYDLLKVLKVDLFTTYRGKEARGIDDLPAKVEAYRLKLAAHFKESKDSEEVIIRIVVDDAVTNLIIYHEDNARSEHKFDKNPDGTRKICPFSFRAAKQDVLTYRPHRDRHAMSARISSNVRTLQNHVGLVHGRVLEGAVAVQHRVRAGVDLGIEELGDQHGQRLPGGRCLAAGRRERVTRSYAPRFWSSGWGSIASTVMSPWSGP